MLCGLLTGNDTSDGVKLDIESPPSSEESKDKTEDDDAADIEVEESNTGRSRSASVNHRQTDHYRVSYVKRYAICGHLMDGLARC